jgi:hypothetical protein
MARLIMVFAADGTSDAAALMRSLAALAPLAAPKNSIERVAERVVLIKNGEEIENADPN